LVDEILKMKDFSHVNILTLLGVALDSRQTPCLVMPFMSNGSLCEYLRKESIRKELLMNQEEPLETVVNIIMWQEIRVGVE
jgi:serine/threonine protein kinase